MDLVLKLNARFQPKDRFPLEDALDEILQERRLGQVSGGGTALKPSGEVDYCDIALHINGDGWGQAEELAGILNAIGIPKGSVLRGDEGEIAVGTLEGLAYYSNGTELPDEVYQTCDINYVIQEMERAMEGIGGFYSHWEGPRDTALYFYGSSFAEMERRIAPFISSYPLCRKSRVEQIA